MIIVLSNSSDETANHLYSQLSLEKLHYLRLDTDNLIGTTKISYISNEISLIVDNQKLKPEEITCIWYRRPEPLKFIDNTNIDDGDKKHFLNEWRAALDGYLSHVPTQLWINHPRNNALASAKLNQLSVAKRLGFEIPKTLVTQDYKKVLSFFHECQDDLITKPISHGYVERKKAIEDTVIYTNEVTLEQITHNKDLLSRCPTLFQEKICKVCDVRVNVVDTEVIATAIYPSRSNHLQATDIRRNNMDDVEYKIANLPPTIKHSLLKICEHYNLRFAAIDMAIDKKGKWIFFEINPNGQWAWLDLKGITDISSLFIRSMV